MRPARRAQALVLGAVSGNLAYSAAHTHAWYLGRFRSYPADRRILVPGLY